MGILINVLIFANLLIIGTLAQLKLMEDYITTDWIAVAVQKNESIENGTLLYWKGCSSDLQQRCNLTCIFIEELGGEVFIDWEINDSEGNSSVDMSFNIPNTYYKLIVSQVNIDPSMNIGNYNCYSTDANGTSRIDNHTFYLTGNQLLPQFEEEITFSVTGSGLCDISYFCKVKANPQPYVLWLQSDPDLHFEVLNSSSISIMTEKNLYEAELKVPQYNSSANYMYSCIAINDVGINVTTPTTAYIPPGEPQFNQTVIPLNNETFGIMCKSNGGFPAPNFSWDILVNNKPVNNILYNVSDTLVDNGESNSVFSMNSISASNNTIIRCNVSNAYSDFEASADVGFVSINSPVIVYTKNCNFTDILTNISCNLECTVYSSTSIFAQWKYISTINWPVKYGYPLSETVGITGVNGYYNTKLTLTDYRSGYYVCVMTSDNSFVQNEFQVSKTSGQVLGDFCYANENCLAMNSECMDNSCICSKDYPVPMVRVDTTAACVKQSNSTNCETDSQCNFGYPISYAFYCDGTCKCSGTTTYIADTNAYQCITPAYFYQKCVYDEQCELTDSNLYCANMGTGYYCNCLPGYVYSYPYQECYSIYGGYLSASAAVGIAFGVILIICIIFIFIMAISKSKQNRRNQAAQRAAANSNEIYQMNGNQHPEYINIDPSVLTCPPIENPPSYGEIRRSETPPPSFEDTVQLKADSSSVLYLVNDNYEPYYKVEGITNEAVEHSA